MATSFIGQSGLPLGLRNNNPGDFRTGVTWLGAIGSENGFITFQDITYGLRALAYDLSAKYTNDGLTTVNEIINKYAPPSENDTAAYVTAVCQDMGGIDPDTDINLNNDPSVLPSLMRAIINHELGAQYSAMVTDADIDTGISMIPANVFQLVGSFFAADPAIASAATVGVIAVGLVLAYSFYRYGKINFSTIKNTLKNAFGNL